MRKIDLAPTPQHSFLERLFQTRDQDGRGILRLILDGSVTTDRDVNTGSIFVDFKEPDLGEIYVGQAPVDTTDYTTVLWDDAKAMEWTAHGVERLEARDKGQASA